MPIIFIVVTISLLYLSTCCQGRTNQCPAAYLRYSTQHSYCVPANASCHIFYKGVAKKEKDFILKYHNDARSKAATGQEKQGDGFPSATNMLELVWDDELAAVAQKRAEQCVYAHDCADCRRVENFAVGQNIAYTQKQCYGKISCPKDTTADWNRALTMFYEEAKDFSKKWINPFQFNHKLGHYTQMISANTWRIGCGFVAYDLSSGYRHFFVCNYGPEGNIIGKPLYQKGSPCSACPLNSCCGPKCSPPGYPGLCRMLDSKVSPQYKLAKSYVLYCDFRNSGGDCYATSPEHKKWILKHTLGGSYAEVVLKGGETTTFSFNKSITTRSRFCVSLAYRTGPTLAGNQSSSDFKVVFQPPGNSYPVTFSLNSDGDSQEFRTINLDLLWSGTTTFKVQFSVPQGAPPQFLNLDKVTASEGNCPSSTG